MICNCNITKPMQALPAYFGGKRKLVDKIFEDICSLSGSTLIDPMGGSMVIPVAAKHIGFDVICNDRMAGPYTIGQALIENSCNTIDVNVVPSLLKKINSDHFVENTYGGIHLPYEIAAQIDTMYGNIQNIETDDRSPYELLLYRYIVFMAPYQQYRYKKLVQQYYTNTVKDSMLHHIKRWNAHIQNPIPTLLNYANQINNAIIEGTGQAFNEDVFEFLDRGLNGDILYLDPPYFGASLNYEASYHVADSMLSREEIRPPTSCFNKRAEEEVAIRRMLSHVHRFQLGIFSYWSKEHSLDWFENIFEELDLHFEYKSINHAYAYSTKLGVNNSQAGERTDWTGDRRKEAGQQEILYFLAPK